MVKKSLSELELLNQRPFTSNEHCYYLLHIIFWLAQWTSVLVFEPKGCGFNPHHGWYYFCFFSTCSYVNHFLRIAELCNKNYSTYFSLNRLYIHTLWNKLIQRKCRCYNLSLIGRFEWLSQTIYRFLGTIPKRFIIYKNNYNNSYTSSSPRKVHFREVSFTMCLYI